MRYTPVGTGRACPLRVIAKQFGEYPRRYGVNWSFLRSVVSDGGIPPQVRGELIRCRFDCHMRPAVIPPQVWGDLAAVGGLGSSTQSRLKWQDDFTVSYSLKVPKLCLSATAISRMIETRYLGHGGCFAGVVGDVLLESAGRFAGKASGLGWREKLSSGYRKIFRKAC